MWPNCLNSFIDTSLVCNTCIMHKVWRYKSYYCIFRIHFVVWNIFCFIMTSLRLVSISPVDNNLDQRGNRPLSDGQVYWRINESWWRHQMETFSTLLTLCAGNSKVTGGFPSQRPVMRNFGVFFDLRLNKRSGKRWWGWWFETPSCPLWRHFNVTPSRWFENDYICRLLCLSHTNKIAVSYCKAFTNHFLPSWFFANFCG